MDNTSISNTVDTFSRDYPASLETMERNLQMMTYYGSKEAQEAATERYIEKIRTFGAATPASRKILREIALEENHGIIEDGFVLYLDNAITQTQNVMPCPEGEVDMAKNYRQRVVIGRDEKGGNIYKHLQAQSEQELNNRIVQAYVDSGRINEFVAVAEQKPKTQTLFKDYAANWLKTYKVDTLKPKTLKSYEGYFVSHLNPAFGDRYIEDITVADVMTFLSERKSMAQKSLSLYLALLRQVLDSAVCDSLVEKNVARDKRVVNPSTKVRKREALTEEQVKDIAQSLYAMESGNEKLFLTLLLFTGCRRGEVLGLMWEDIDFEKKLIHIRRNVTHVTNAPIIGTPKTKNGERTIPFGEHFEELVTPMRGTGFIIGGKEPISIKAFKTMMKRLNAKVNLYGATPHVLRHTFLTFLSANGTDMKTLQAVAGHADIQTTMNIYVHPSMANIKKAGNTMDNMLHGYATHAVS